MNIILLTILLTLLGAGLVVLLVWLSVVSWKSIKFKRESILNFSNLEKKIEETDIALYKKADEIYQNIDDTRYKTIEYIDKHKTETATEFERVYNRIGTEVDELHRNSISSLYDKIDKNSEQTTTHIANIERSIDSRFDKQFKALTELINSRFNEKSEKKNK